MSARAGCRFVAVLVMGLAVAGCSSTSGVREGLTLAQAKIETQAMEREIAAAVPADFVEQVDQHAKGSLLGCDRGRGHTWSGLTVVTVTPDASASKVLSSIVERLSPDGWALQRTEDAYGDHLLDVSGSFGATYIVRYSTEKGTLRITSASECFRLPKDAWTQGMF